MRQILLIVLRHSKLNQNKGFNLLELMIVALIGSILTAATVPNLGGLHAKMQLNDALSDVENALREAQREAIRKSKQCTLKLYSNKVANDTDSGTEDCLTSERIFDSRVSVAHNGADTIQYGFQGNTTSNQTIILSHGNLNQVSDTKCIVISSPLGIIRTGIYNVTGSNTTGSNITDSDCEEI